MLLNRGDPIPRPDPLSSISAVEDDFNVYSRLVLGIVCLLFLDIRHTSAHTVEQLFAASFYGLWRH